MSRSINLWGLWLAILVMGASARFVLAGNPAESVPEVIHVALAKDATNGVLLNDAKAATKIWVESISMEQGETTVKADVQVYADQAGLRAAVDRRGADLIIMGTDDFYALGGAASFNRVYFYARGGEVTEKYLLLARADSGIASLAGLRGRKLILLDTVRTRLAERWINSLLRRDGLPAVREFAQEMVTDGKASKCVQRVFFRNTDACLVTAQSFRTIVELNPQLGKQLAVLAESPPYVPSVIAIRNAYTPKLWPDLERAILTAHTKPKGKQLLRMYTIDRLVRQTGNELASAKALLAKTGEAGDTAPAAPATAQPPVGSESTP